MRSVSIVLLAVVVAVTAQTKGMKLSELMTNRNQQEGLCELCKMFFNTITGVIDEAFNWLNQEIEDLCNDGFAGNSTAVDVCKKKAETAVTKIRDFIEIEEAPEAMCHKLYLC
uniref:Saposin B-type domain-containing protein n=1 Tax=Elaeophora elaphi TaxID=1147741 RepID=A0A0R3RK84_9BILA